MIVNQKELAQCLGISDRRIRQLKEVGLFKAHKVTKGYMLENCIQEYIEYRVNAETGRRKSISKEEVQAEHEEIKKQISIMKLRRLRRETHEAADVEAFLASMLTGFRNRLMDIPAKLAVKVAGVSDINEVMLMIERELETVLRELQEYDPEKIDGPSGEDPYDEDEDEDETE